MNGMLSDPSAVEGRAWPGGPPGATRFHEVLKPLSRGATPGSIGAGAAALAICQKR